MTSGLHEFATPKLRRFEIPDLRTFATSELRRFKIPDLRMFDIPETCYTNFINLDVSRVIGFPEFPNSRNMVAI
jgi:hypothetical protein